eukprot:TRINITY_DN37353_c0_g1_i1.p1 TRINITY_DN37353_c0_g1~~TRINITY_DN37353_c0_g1_i1.p1  ORF type:complete len:1071 (-),score=244.06 TRINITY_DN37353_c0_g1_i1:112-3324(-)
MGHAPSTGHERGRRSGNMGVFGATCSPHGSEFDTDALVAMPIAPSDDRATPSASSTSPVWRQPRAPRLQESVNEELQRLAKFRRAASDVFFGAKRLEENLMLKEVLRSASMCAGLKDSELDAAVADMKYYVFDVGQAVMQEGHPGTHVFVASGDGLQVSLGGKKVGTIRRGECFGELALVEHCHRAVVTVRAAEEGSGEVGVWAAPAEKLRRSLRAAKVRFSTDVRQFLEHVELFKGCSASQLDVIADHCSLEVLNPGDDVGSLLRPEPANGRSPGGLGGAKANSDGQKGAFSSPSPYKQRNGSPNGNSPANGSASNGSQKASRKLATFLVKAGELVLSGVEGGRTSTTAGSAPLIFRPGHVLGDRALLYGQPCSVLPKVQALRRTELLRVDLSGLSESLGERSLSPQLLHRGTLLAALESCQDVRFAAWSDDQRKRAVDEMQVLQFSPSDVIRNRVQFFVVLDGSVFHGPPAGKHANEDSAPPIYLNAVSRGQWWLSDSPGALEVQATHFVAGPQGCRIALLTPRCIALAEAQQVVPPPFPRSGMSSQHLQGARILAQLTPFMHIPLVELESFCSAHVTKRICSRGERLFVEGDAACDLYVLVRGEVGASANGVVVRTFKPLSYFGDLALLPTTSDKPPKQVLSVSVTTAPAEIWELSGESLRELLEKYRGGVLSRVHQSATLNVRDSLMSRATWRETAPARLKELTRSSILGAGTAGVVFLVQDRRKQRFALKRVAKLPPKKDAPKDGKEEPQYVRKAREARSSEARREAEILLEEVDHPFCMLILRRFETERGVYLLSEHISGGELYTAIRSVETVLSRWQAMFYIGSLVLALEALDRHRIVYRDLKPENVMLDDMGYVRLIDFGTAQRLSSSSEDETPRTFTKVGTPHYMAPEMVSGEGYGLSVDVWALGVVLFELTCGCLPFGDDLTAPSDVFKAVRQAELEIPAELDDVSSKALILALLERTPTRRLGCGSAGITAVKYSSFFNMHEFQPQAGSSAAHCHPDNAEYFSLLLCRRIPAPLAPQAPPVPTSSRRPSKSAPVRPLETEFARQASSDGDDEDELWENT